MLTLTTMSKLQLGKAPVRTVRYHSVTGYGRCILSSGESALVWGRRARCGARAGGAARRREHGATARRPMEILTSIYALLSGGVRRSLSLPSGFISFYPGVMKPRCCDYSRQGLQVTPSRSAGLKIQDLDLKRDCVCVTLHIASHIRVCVMSIGHGLYEDFNSLTWNTQTELRRLACVVETYWVPSDALLGCTISGRGEESVIEPAVPLGCASVISDPCDRSSDIRQQLSRRHDSGPDVFA
ncbi:hypothetical protein EVAR_17767_1 [Eumeta japonica]|uniref:Uncharacterized protein n=1 Tax=Eumeta variegata TaxID=151549 RepID=A0A4C1TTF7_EUMVA|nr:hypothetical protein EVAR_17767_1 [Eumeta japonica]